MDEMTCLQDTRLIKPNNSHHGILAKTIFTFTGSLEQIDSGFKPTFRYNETYFIKDLWTIVPIKASTFFKCSKAKQIYSKTFGNPLSQNRVIRQQILFLWATPIENFHLLDS